MLLEEEMPGSEGKMERLSRLMVHARGRRAAQRSRKAIYEAAKSGVEEILTQNVEEFFQEQTFQISVS